MEVSVKVRGIYATALTALFLDAGLRIVGATAPIRARFGLDAVDDDHDVAVYDTEDRRGVFLEGGTEAVIFVADLLRRELPHAVRRVRRLADIAPGSGQRLSWDDFVRRGQTRIEMEFPLDARLSLDRWRARVVPTLPFHHHLKIIDAARVDAAESELVAHPERAAFLAEGLKEELIYRHYAGGNTLSVYHIKPEGRVYTFRGSVAEFRRGRLRLVRHFRGGGRYDSLEVPKEEGDYGYFEVVEQGWVARRSYFGRDGAPKGVIYNINTPAEFYPDAVRYIDLEIDVVQRPDGSLSVVDTSELEVKVKQGLLAPALAERAREVVRKLTAALARGEEVFQETL